MKQRPAQWSMARARQRAPKGRRPFRCCVSYSGSPHQLPLQWIVPQAASCLRRGCVPRARPCRDGGFLCRCLMRQCVDGPFARVFCPWPCATLLTVHALASYARAAIQWDWCYDNAKLTRGATPQLRPMPFEGNMRAALDNVHTSHFPGRDDTRTDASSPCQRDDASVAHRDLSARFVGPWSHRPAVTRSGVNKRAEPAGGWAPGGGQVRLASSVVTMNGVAVSSSAKSGAVKSGSTYAQASWHTQERGAEESASKPSAGDGAADDVRGGGQMRNGRGCAKDVLQPLAQARRSAGDEPSACGGDEALGGASAASAAAEGLPRQCPLPQPLPKGAASAQGSGATGNGGSGAHAGGVGGHAFTKIRPSAATTFADRERQRFGSSAPAHSSAAANVFVVGSALGDAPVAAERVPQRRMTRSRGAMRSGETKLSGPDPEAMAAIRAIDPWDKPPAGIAGIPILANPGGDAGNASNSSSVTVCMSPLSMHALLMAQKSKPTALAPARASSPKRPAIRRFSLFVSAACAIAHQSRLHASLLFCPPPPPPLVMPRGLGLCLHLLCPLLFQRPAPYACLCVWLLCVRGIMGGVPRWHGGLICALISVWP